MRIFVICNHSFGFRAINFLIKKGFVTGIGASGKHSLVIDQLQNIAEVHNLSFTNLQKDSLKKKFKNWLTKLNPDVVFVFSFAYQIPEDILAIPKFGFINFHPSILPLYRGPDPVFWQLKNSERETGITAHKMGKDFDTGPVIRIEKEAVSETDTYGILTDKLSYTLIKCAGNVIDLLQESESKKIFVKQDNTAATYFRRPDEEDLRIKWQDMKAEEILSLIKACNPNYEGAATSFRGFPIRILEAEIGSANSEKIEPGVIICEGTYLGVGAIDYLIKINIIYEGEGIFTGSQFIELFQVKSGERFQ